MKLRQCLLALVVLSGSLVARAQVELLYSFKQQRVAIAGLLQGQQVYVDHGAQQLAPAGGFWSLRPGPGFADLTGPINFTYSLRKITSRPQPKDGRALVDFEIEFRGEREAGNVYFYAYWEKDGKNVPSELRAYTYVSGTYPSTCHGQLEIKGTARDGRLHLYLFQNGRSLPGVAKKEMALAPFRAALDAGEIGAAKDWLRGPGKTRALTRGLVEQVAQLGDLELLQLAMASAGPLGGRDLGAVLVAAVKAEREACVDYLLGLKASANSADARGEPVLNSALMTGATSLAAKLLAAGADPAKESKGGYAPVDVAFDCGDVAMIQLLLDHGMKWPGAKGAANLFADAVAKGRADIVALCLAHGADPNQMQNKAPVIMTAAMRADVSTLDVLLKAGAKPDNLNGNGQNAIMGAAYSGDTSTVIFLLKAGASLEIADASHRNAAAYALMGGHPDLAIEMTNLKTPAGVAGSRLLHDALLRNEKDLVELLVGHGITLNLAEPDIDRVLDHVIATGNAGLFKQALAGGLDPNRRIYADWTLAGLAERYHQEEIRRELDRQAGAALKVVEPADSKIPTGVITKGPGILPADVDKDLEKGTAEIDVFVDAAGTPVAPVIHYASNESIGRAALKDIVAWRFNPLPEKARDWRRTTIPYLYSSDPLGTRIFRTWEVSEPPIRRNRLFPNLKADGEGGVPQAAVVRYVVSRTGEVTSPEVIGSTSPETNPRFLEHIKTWRYFPATIGKVPVATQLVTVMLEPGGSEIGPDSFVALSTPQTVNWPVPDRLKRGSVSYDRSGKPLPGRGVVILRFGVTKLGYTSNIQVLGSSDAELTKRARKVCEEMEFKPADAERVLLWISTPGNWDDVPVFEQLGVQMNKKNPPH